MSPTKPIKIKEPGYSISIDFKYKGLDLDKLDRDAHYVIRRIIDAQFDAAQKT